MSTVSPCPKSYKARLAVAKRVLAALEARYQTPQVNLVANNPWQLMVATILAAQCTDARVNTLTPELFRRWPGPAELADAPLEELEEVIRPAGFYHSKAKNLLACAARVRDVHNGEVPKTIEELVQLGGVARKTANVVLWGGFGINAGLAVDTHVKRITYRLGLTDNTDPIPIEQDLMALFPQAEWGNVNHRMVWFGRDVCDARKPRCGECELAAICPRREPPKTSGGRRKSVAKKADK